jgi:hypothetical protein
MIHTSASAAIVAPPSHRSCSTRAVSPAASCEGARQKAPMGSRVSASVIAERCGYHDDPEHDGPPRCGQLLGEGRDEMGDDDDRPAEQQQRCDDSDEGAECAAMQQQRADRDADARGEDALDHDQRHRESRGGRPPAGPDLQRRERDRQKQQRRPDERRQQHRAGDREPAESEEPQRARMQQVRPHDEHRHEERAQRHHHADDDDDAVKGDLVQFGRERGTAPQHRHAGAGEHDPESGPRGGCGRAKRVRQQPHFQSE